MESCRSKLVDSKFRPNFFFLLDVLVGWVVGVLVFCFFFFLCVVLWLSLPATAYCPILSMSVHSCGITPLKDRIQDNYLV